MNAPHPAAPRVPSNEMGGEGAQGVAALYVRSDTIYRELGADCWDVQRDARFYKGPWPVVAHPPCKRWGCLYWTNGSKRPGQDGGLFEHALDMVRTHGGVLEHPAGSRAWSHFSLIEPPRRGWSRSLLRQDEWSCAVAQSAYGHPARKLTWLFYVGARPPAPLDWRRPRGEAYAVPPATMADLPAGMRLCTKLEREATPRPFAKLLISLAQGAKW